MCVIAAGSHGGSIAKGLAGGHRVDGTVGRRMSRDRSKGLELESTLSTDKARAQSGLETLASPVPCPSLCPRCGTQTVDHNDHLLISCCAQTLCDALVYFNPQFSTFPRKELQSLAGVEQSWSSNPKSH